MSEIKWPLFCDLVWASVTRWDHAKNILPVLVLPYYNLHTVWFSRVEHVSQLAYIAGPGTTFWLTITGRNPILWPDKKEHVNQSFFPNHPWLRQNNKLLSTLHFVFFILFCLFVSVSLCSFTKTENWWTKVQCTIIEFVLRFMAVSEWNVQSVALK